MSAREDLRGRIEHLLGGLRARKESRSTATGGEMAAVLERLDRFDAVAHEWTRGLVVPKLETMAALFPNSLPLVRSAVCHHATLGFRQTDEFPADARVEVRVSLHHVMDRVRVTFVASIVPILMEFEREATIEFDLDCPDADAVAEFLDERVVRFVGDYLRIRDPESPYQKDRIVTDSVCGMTMPRAKAGASLEHGGRTHYFCGSECRERFESDSERYARNPRGANGRH
jgi:YHS domain-containing protein